MRWEGEDVDAVVASAELLSALAIDLRKCCANLQISMIRIRQRALVEIELSRKFWAGPNAELFRKSAKLYIDGTLDVPRRQVRSMPIGLAREYTSGLIDKLKNFERDLNTCVGNFKTSAAALSAVREELAKKKSEHESAKERRHLDFYSSANMESVFLQADIERLQEQEATDVKAVLKHYQELKMIGSKFRAFSDESRSELVKCSREMSRQNSHMQEIVNRLRFEVLWHQNGEIDLPDYLFHTVVPGIVPSPKAVLVEARKELQDLSLWGALSSDVMLQVPTKAGDLPGFAKSWKPVQEQLERFPKGSSNFKAFSNAIAIAYFSLETWKDMSDVALEKHVWTEFIKEKLRLPDGIFEKFFKPEVDAAFRSNRISQVLMNAFKAFAALAAFAIPGGLVVTVAIGVAVSFLVEAADKTYVETAQDRELEGKLEFAVEMGFRNWRAAEDKEGAINPLLYSAKNKF